MKRLGEALLLVMLGAVTSMLTFALVLAGADLLVNLRCAA